MAPLLAIYIFCKDSFAHSCYWYNAHGPSSPAPQPTPETVATTYVLQQPEGAAGMLQPPYPSNSGPPTSYQY